MAMAVNASAALANVQRPGAAAKFLGSRIPAPRSSVHFGGSVSTSTSLHKLSSRSSSRLLTPVATATDPAPSSVQQKTQYHFLVANAKFMLDDEEHLQELLRERLRNYDERNKEQDFWLVIEPKFLEKFPELTKRLNRPAVALISTDPVWITYMKLRIDRVLKGVFEAESLEEATGSNPIDVQFKEPEKWTAPYPKYESGWWTPFLHSSTK